jgi:hypothetical protein
MRYLILLAALAIAACGSSSDDSSAAEAVEQGSDVLGESLHESLEAAEAVEDELMKSKEDMDAAIEKAE